jgi:lipopolysaccharide/colanic/teichoic acid biosynthesis glycosyltransferase
MYAKGLKRVMDFCLSLGAIAVLSPVLLILMLVWAIAMKGNPFFTQLRPGKDERIFRLIKFRTMSNAKDKEGNLLPDDVRLNGYGRFLRSTSLDELPELFNILVGDMAVVGPRPQLVRDMVFMTDEQRRRHTVRPGLTGLAQINGRNSVTWEKKLEFDLVYLEKITFIGDWRIIFGTVGKVFARDGISEEGMDTAEDLGDYLLRTGRVDREEYDARQLEAKTAIQNRRR